MKKLALFLLVISACATTPKIEIPKYPYVCEDQACVDRYWGQQFFWLTEREPQGIHLVYPDGKILQGVASAYRGVGGTHYIYIKIQGVSIIDNKRQPVDDTIKVPLPQY